MKSFRGQIVVFQNAQTGEEKKRNCITVSQWLELVRFKACINNDDKVASKSSPLLGHTLETSLSRIPIIRVKITMRVRRERERERRKKSLLNLSARD
jgi:hypothetical protein